MAMKKDRERDSAFKQALGPYMLAAPLILLIALFVLLPAAGSLCASFFQDIAFLNKKFIFLDNYYTLYTDGEFLQSLRFTILFTAVSVPLEVMLGLIFAVILNLNIPFRGVVRGCLLVPWVVPSVVSARTWQLIYNYSDGLANFLLLKLGLASGPINWLGTGTGAFAAAVTADVWRTTPFAAIILLAALQGIPGDLYRQAKVDRAGPFRIFFRITLPLIKPALLAVLLFRTIDALRVFDILYVLTHGGPGGSTTSLSLLSYKYFQGGDFGYGSAVSAVLFIIAFILSVIYVKSINLRKELG